MSSSLFTKLSWLTVICAALSIRTGIWIVSDDSLFIEEYLPFLHAFVASPALDPWSDWALNGSSPDSFPYGFAALALFSPLGLLDPTIAEIVYLGILFAAELALAVALLKLGVGPSYLIVGLLISPAQLLSIYGIGANDVIVAAGFAWALQSLKIGRYFLASLLMGLTVALKPVAVVLLVAILLYAFASHDSGKRTLQIAMTSVLIGGLSYSPLLYSQGFRDATAANREIRELFEAKLDVTPGPDLLLLPVTMLAVAVFVWFVPRKDLTTILALLSTVFFVLGSFLSSPMGWSVFASIALLLTSRNYSKRILAAAFTILQLQAFLKAIDTTGIASDLFVSFWGQYLPMLSSLVSAGTFAIGFAVMKRTLEKPLSRRSRSNPVAVAISGDSGVGKDSLADSIADLLGRRRTARVSGDDFHNWVRGRGEWHYLTHLNPRANDLPGFFAATRRLLAGQSVSVSHYDHSTGQKLAYAEVRPRQNLIVSGLHALTDSAVNSNFDLTIYLSMDASLREAIKVKRDVTQRGQRELDVRESIQRRIPDFNVFIEPQRRLADLSIHLGSYASGPDSANSIDDNFYIEAVARPTLRNGILQRKLRELPGLRVSNWVDLESGGHAFRVSGRTNAGQLRDVLSSLMTTADDLFMQDAVWRSGPQGIVQLIAAFHLLQEVTDVRRLG